MSGQRSLFAAPGEAGDGPRGEVERETFSPTAGGARGIDKASDAWAAREEGRPHFYRCADCLTVLCCDAQPGRPGPGGLTCGACGGREEYMGQAGKQPGRLTRTSVESVCDDRCTGARGPHCECRCCGRNHGSGRWVLVTRDAGKAPTITPGSERERVLGRLRAEEYREALAEARGRLGWFWALQERKQGGEYLSGDDFRRLCAGRRAVRALHKAEEARTHKGRLAKLARVGGER